MQAGRVIFLVLFVFLACAKKEETAQPAAQPAPAPAPSQPAVAATTSSAAPATASVPAAAAPQGIATADGELGGVKATVTELKRGSGDTLSLKITLTNGSTERLDFGYRFVDKDHDNADYGSIGGIHLIDPAGKKKYFVARDSDGKCVCSRGLKDVEPGQSINLWAKFPAPPPDVEKISIVLAHFSPMDDVPISK
jgi:hypothetical protein